MVPVNVLPVYAEDVLDEPHAPEKAGPACVRLRLLDALGIHIRPGAASAELSGRHKLLARPLPVSTFRVEFLSFWQEQF